MTKPDEEAKQPILRVMFLFTDGRDNASNLTGKEAEDALVAANVRVIARVPQQGTEHHAKWVLEQFTKRTGGLLFVPGNDAGLERTVAKVLSDLDSLFEISYVPSSNHREISKVELKARKSGILIVAPESVGSEQFQ